MSQMAYKLMDGNDEDYIAMEEEKKKMEMEEEEKKKRREAPDEWLELLEM